MSHFGGDQDHPYGRVLQEGTLNGNAVAAVAGLATLKVLKREGTYVNLFRIGGMIKEGFERILMDAEIPAQVIGEPPMFDILFTNQVIRDYRDSLRCGAGKNARLVELLRERGIYKNDAKFYVSTAHDERDVEEVLVAFESVVEAL